MLRNKVAKEVPQRFSPLLFRKHLGDVSGHGLCSTRTNFPVNSGELFLGERDGNFRGSHTGIIPPEE
jgi:hypothetical protein